MGQKVNPHGLRVGVIKDWDSRWFAGKRDFGDTLVEDFNIRKYLLGKTYSNDKSPYPMKPGISNIEIERDATKIKIFIHTARPGLLIGQKGAEIDRIKVDVEKITKGKPVNLNIVEVKEVDLAAKLVAEDIARQLEMRTAFRRAMKSCIKRTMDAGAHGIKTMVSGRLGGAEIARSESYHEGTIPLHTLRADIDYAHAEAHTTYGIVGVKVWIYKGEVLKGEAGAKQRQIAERTRKRRDEHPNRGERNDRNDRRGRAAGGDRPFRRDGQGGPGGAGRGGFGGRGGQGGGRFGDDRPTGPRPQGGIRNAPAPKPAPVAEAAAPVATEAPAPAPAETSAE
ncbi:MAG: 30S ribosomal protein S3 [Oscillospiraceae bacterium]|nr:30S ribosomal protein S3 [Oscillospiraceae bacterium]